MQRCLGTYICTHAPVSYSLHYYTLHEFVIVSTDIHAVCACCQEDEPRCRPYHCGNLLLISWCPDRAKVHCFANNISGSWHYWVNSPLLSSVTFQVEQSVRSFQQRDVGSLDLNMSVDLSASQGCVLCLLAVALTGHVPQYFVLLSGLPVPMVVSTTLREHC